MEWSRFTARLHPAHIGHLFCLISKGYFIVIVFFNCARMGPARGAHVEQDALLSALGCFNCTSYDFGFVCHPVPDFELRTTSPWVTVRIPLDGPPQS